MLPEEIISIKLIFIISFCLFTIIGEIICLIYWWKKTMLKIKLQHEIDKKENEFNQKIRWEEFIKWKIEVKKDEELQKEKNELKKRVDELWAKRHEITPLDMNRIALLHLILSGNKESITAENLEKEIDKVKKSYEIIKNYLN